MAVETKVQASTAAAAVSGLALFVLGRYVFRGAVPDVVASWVYALIPGVLAFGAGYLARHTNRPLPPVLPALAPPVPVPPEKTPVPPAAAATEPPAAAGEPPA